MDKLYVFPPIPNANTIKGTRAKMLWQSHFQGLHVAFV